MRFEARKNLSDDFRMLIREIPNAADQ
jgi:hypothetical protein